MAAPARWHISAQQRGQRRELVVVGGPHDFRLRGPTAATQPLTLVCHDPHGHPSDRAVLKAICWRAVISADMWWRVVVTSLRSGMAILHLEPSPGNLDIEASRGGRRY
jgi:hypothetical protein